MPFLFYSGCVEYIRVSWKRFLNTCGFELNFLNVFLHKIRLVFGKQNNSFFSLSLWLSTEFFFIFCVFPEIVHTDDDDDSTDDGLILHFVCFALILCLVL